jgi:hypothetical protein
MLLFMENPPSPLSSRAKPRDLRFSGPLLEMFLGAVTAAQEQTSLDIWAAA